MTPLAELTRGFTTEVLLKDERANGTGVRVAVIDTGVNTARLSYTRVVAQTFRGPEPFPLPETLPPSGPHGTTVADIILRLAPAVELYSADVFLPGGLCELETLIAALRYAIREWNAKVVNLSLGISEHSLQALPRLQTFRRVIEEAYAADVLVFAAAPNDHPLSRSYPAAFSAPLVSVDKGLFQDAWQFAYVPQQGIEFQAYSQGYVGAFAKEPTTSWATPHLAGLAARLLSWNPKLKPFEVKTLLYWMSQQSTTVPIPDSPD